MTVQGLGPELPELNLDVLGPWLKQHQENPGSLLSSAHIPLQGWEVFGPQLLVLLTLVTEQTRYDAHHERMAETLTTFGALDTPGMRIAVALHDVVDHLVLNQPDQDVQEEVRDYLREMHDAQNEEGQRLFEYGLGVACGAGRWEEAAERWRSDINEGLQQLERSDDEVAPALVGLAYVLLRARPGVM